MMESNPKNTANISVIGIERSSVDTQLKTPEKHDNSKKVSFFSGLRPIFRLSRVFGLMPFSIIRSCDAGALEPRVKPRDILWLIVSIFVYSITAYVMYGSIHSPNDSNPTSSIFRWILFTSICGHYIWHPNDGHRLVQSF